MTQTKTDRGNFFEDFTIGHVFSCPTPRVLTVGDVSQYIALTGDRTPRFCDDRYQIHPLLLFHLVLGQTVRQISLNARANLGYAGLVWQHPVFAGDTIRTTAKVLGLKENSNQKTGIVYVHTEARNQKDQVVLEYTRWVMVKKKGSEATAYLKNPSIPELPKVDLAVLKTGSFQIPQDGLPHADITGSALYFQDYQKGERINHIDGLVINDSDHMSFTKLFQNSAKIHFDPILTDGKPLVYGGVPISYGYAQGFNGLPNRCGLFAINAGSHSNPVYQGDTLYSFTEVLDTHTFDPSAKVGALRLRLVVVKNEMIEDVDSFAIQVDHPEKPGKKIYSPNVVLDLDYWETVALG